MPMCNLIEYSDSIVNNYSDTSGILCHFKKDESPANNANFTVDNNSVFYSQSSKYKAVLVGKTTVVAGGNSFIKDAQIVVLLKYLGNFWKSLEMSLIKCQIHLELNWIENCILFTGRTSAKLKIMDIKLPVPVVTLATKDKVNLRKQDCVKRFQIRSCFWSVFSFVKFSYRIVLFLCLQVLQQLLQNMNSCRYCK